MRLIHNALILLCLIFPALAFSKSVGESRVAWSKNKISVCFAAPSQSRYSEIEKMKELTSTLVVGSDVHKTWIKDIITAEYSVEKTGIEFVGWQPCYEIIPSDIMIFFGAGNENSLGMSVIGENGVIVNESFGNSHYEKSGSLKRPYVYFDFESDEGKLSKQEHIQLLALHEFGHAAGLRHEHARLNDLRDDSNCILANQFIFPEPLYKTSSYYSDYDANSVMNYCYIGSLIKVGTNISSFPSKIKISDEGLIACAALDPDCTVRIGLSAKDVHALKCLYGGYSETEQKNCKSM